ncbi:MAG: hypothetical protein DRR11_02310 [Gammaproteobacteria bacterium]|nr:MAG: hypothetical protein DRR11_02310 [Gammaproteobacteria bacterium]
MSATVFAQSDYSEETLAVKRRFSGIEDSALADPFVGVTTESGKQADLFPIRATGVSTKPIVESALAFLSTLTQTQKIKTQFAVDDPEWRKWSNIDNGIYVRQGISFEEMVDTQKTAAWNLLRSSLSADGLGLSRNIMKTDQTLKELNNDGLSYGEEKYFITMMGIPSESQPWGWQLDGHHLVINYFVLGDQVVVTPMFLGAEPAVAKSGKYIGNAVLQEEQNQGLRFLQSLDDEQQSVAILQSRKSAVDINAEAWKDNLVLSYAGIAASKLSSGQKDQLVGLIELFVRNIRDEHARVRMEEVAEHLDDTYFAWVGDITDDAVFYFRIHSPVILIEFDHQRPVGNVGLARGVPTRQHVHVVVRTPNGNDYGKDLLRQHLEAHSH